MQPGGVAPARVVRVNGARRAWIRRVWMGKQGVNSCELKPLNTIMFARKSVPADQGVGVNLHAIYADVKMNTSTLRGVRKRAGSPAALKGRERTPPTPEITTSTVR